MSTFNWKKISFGIAFVFITIILVWQASKFLTAPKPVSAEEATNKVQELYKGEIVNVQEEAQAYRITIELDTGTYEVVIDRESGEIAGLTRTKKTDNNETTAENGQSPVQEGSSSPGNEPSVNPVQPVKQLTEEEAIAIALSQINGEVDEVEIEQSGGLTYYLIEVSANDEDEATIQINSISGEVMSITWDD